MAFDLKDLSKLASSAGEMKEKLDDLKGIAKLFGGKDGSSADVKEIVKKVLASFDDLGDIKNLKPSDDKVQSMVGDLVKKLGCDSDTLKSIGKLVTSNSDIKEKLDKEGGNGTAEFIKESIEAFLKKNK